MSPELGIAVSAWNVFTLSGHSLNDISRPGYEMNFGFSEESWKK